MAYCFNCQSEYPDDVPGADEFHTLPCGACPSEGHSSCQCEGPEERPAAAVLRRLRAPHTPHGDSGDAA